jgi:hypothetical protein
MIEFVPHNHKTSTINIITVNGFAENNVKSISECRKTVDE